MNRYRICLSLYGSTEQICTAIDESTEADLFEVRLDLSPECDVERICACTGKPVLLTAQEMPELQQKWGALADFVDVGQGHPFHPHSIRSYHGGEQDPESALEQLKGGEISKLVLETSDYMTMVKLLESNRRLAPHSICFASGEEGRFSRILSLFYGAQWSYACFPGRPTAPGQFSLNEYVNLYRIRRFEGDKEIGEDREMNGDEGIRTVGRAMFRPKVFGIMGDPVSHSRSPEYHNRRFEEEGLPWIYLPFRCTNVDALLQSAPLFGSVGFSITHPLKREVLPYLDEKSPKVIQLGSCNTVCYKNGKWHGANTDEFGVRSLLESAAIPLEGKTFLLVGAGATARVVASVVRTHVQELIIMNRTREKADLLASEFQGRSVPLSSAVPYDILFHTTPIGLQGGEIPINAGLLRPGTVVIDAIYSPPRTPLLRIAEARGCRVFNGEAWFLAQAEAQFQWWRKMLKNH